MSEICFIEARPRVVATGAESVVRLAGGGAAASYYRAGEHYRAGVVQQPRFRGAFGFDQNGWTGGTVPTVSALNVMPGGGTAIAELSALYWRDAPIIIDAGEEGGALARRLTGTVAEVANSEGQLAFTITDPSRTLDKPLLGAGFAGTGGTEGPAEATGRVKRRSWGRVFNVEGALLDAANSIYEFGDPACPLQAFDALRDMGRAGPTTALAWQGSIAATFAALQASTAPEGGGVVAPSIACAKWWTEPAGPLTADLRGEVAGGYAETAVGIAARLLSAVAGPAIADQAAADALRPGVCGIHVASPSDTVAQAIDRLFLGMSLLWVLQPAGTIRIGEWAWTAPVAALNAIFLTRERQLPPIKSRKVGYRRNHCIHQASEISVAAVSGFTVSPNAPSAYVSSPGQLWQAPDGGYWRRRDDVNLSIGGRLTIAGNAISIAFTPTESQPVTVIGGAAAAAQAQADAAASAAAIANATLADIASDDLLTPGEKLGIILDVDTINAERAGIVAQAVGFGITTEKAAYEGAVDALTAYLATLTAPTAWNATAGNTAIAGPTFRTKFGDVYTARQTLLNQIAAVTKAEADAGVAAAAAAQGTADAAASNASAALAALADISSDDLLTPGEKPAIVLDVNVLTGEQAGIDAQAVTLGIVAEKTAYDDALAALSAYLATLTAPVLWSNLGGNTTIAGATFRGKFADAYAARQALLNKFAAVIKGIADSGVAGAAAAQSAADAAAGQASSALAGLADIANDDLLTPGEKSTVILDVTAINNEKAEILAQATAFGIAAEKTAYDDAVGALTAYLATLTAPVLWSNLGGNTTIVGPTFRGKFADVYSTRQTLLNKIADVAKARADAGVAAAAAAQGTADAAAASAATANAALADIASDNLLTPGEKPAVILDRDVITGEQAGIDAQAVTLGITTEKTAYDNAVAALTSYLATLTAPVLWSNLGGNTGIVGATFRSKFADVYSARQALLNKISAVLKAQGDAAAAVAAAAQGTANGAAANATAALTALSEISSDSLLTPGEKPRVIQDRDVITGEQAGIDAQATAYAITTEKTAYDNAVSALTSYLATLTTPVLWSNLGDNTTIVGATFRSKFADVYSARQAVLNKIAEKAGTVATWGGLTGTGKPEDSADVTSQITGQADIIINADYTGAVTTSLPKVQPYALIRNGTDVTASATWSATVLSGTIAASFPTAGGLSIDASGGVLTTSTLRITAVYNGTTRTLDVRVTKKLTDPPPSGNSSASSGISATILGTTPVALTGDLDITVAASGHATLSASYTFTTALSGGSQSMTTEWYEWNGSAWVAISGSQVAASSAYVPVTGEPGEGSNTAGRSGMTPGAAKKYRLYGFNSGGTTGATRYVSGSSSAVSS